MQTEGWFMCRVLVAKLSSIGEFATWDSSDNFFSSVVKFNSPETKIAKFYRTGTPNRKNVNTDTRHFGGNHRLKIFGSFPVTVCIDDTRWNTRNLRRRDANKGTKLAFGGKKLRERELSENVVSVRCSQFAVRKNASYVKLSAFRGFCPLKRKLSAESRSTHSLPMIYTSKDACWRDRYIWYLSLHITTSKSRKSWPALRTEEFFKLHARRNNNTKLCYFLAVFIPTQI